MLLVVAAVVELVAWMSLLVLAAGMLLHQGLDYSEKLCFEVPLRAAMYLPQPVNSVPYSLASSGTSQIVRHLRLGNISYLLEEQHIENCLGFDPNEHCIVIWGPEWNSYNLFELGFVMN